MSKFNRRITGDLYDIADRLKEIDPSYFLIYNTELDRYEVHSDKNIHSTLCLVSPYKYLDQRLLALVRETRRERARQLFAEMERTNAAIEQAAQKEQEEKNREVLSEIVKYAKGADISAAQTEEVRRRCLGL